MTTYKDEVKAVSEALSKLPDVKVLPVPSERNHDINFMALKARVAKARHEAYREARLESKRSNMPWVWSRGTWFSTVDERGDQAQPYPGAEAAQWNGTKRELEAVIAKVERDYPDVMVLYVEGGYDGGETINDKKDGIYEPWISNWSVDVWRRNGAPLQD